MEQRQLVASPDELSIQRLPGGQHEPLGRLVEDHLARPCPQRRSQGANGVRCGPAGCHDLPRPDHDAGRAQLLGRPHCPQRVVLVDDRDPEDARDAAAVPLDAAAVPLDRGRPGIECGRASLRIGGGARFHPERGDALPLRQLGLGHGFVQRGVLGEDRLLEAAQLLAGLDPELLDQNATRLAIGSECIRLAPGAVEGQDLLPAQPLTQRMLRHERLQLARERGVAPGGEVGLDPLLQHRDPQLLEPLHLRLRPALVAEVRERRPAPEVECLPVRAGRGELFEAACIDSLRVELERVAAAARRDRVAAERLAQLRDVDLDDLRGRLGSGAVPELLDEPVGGDRLGRMEREQRQQSLLASRSERHRGARAADAERSEDVDGEIGHLRGVYRRLGGGSHDRTTSHATHRKESDMRHLSLIAVLAALIVSAASGTIVWSDSVSAGDQIIWGD